MSASSELERASELSSGPDIVLLCNPQAGGRWTELARILDSDEARHVRRIVTDSVEDVAPAVAALGRHSKLLCIYGGDGTIQRILDQLPADLDTELHLALIGGGTMNVTSRWCGFHRSPAENFRYVVNGYRRGDLLLRDVPLLEVRRGGRCMRGFTFGMGPMVRALDVFERGNKSKRAAVALTAKSMVAAWLPIFAETRAMLEEMEAEVALDGAPLPYSKFSVLFANVTGQLNPGVTPFVMERTRDTFHCAAYAATSREVAAAVPMLAKGVLPIDAGTMVGRLLPFGREEDRSPTDPRYVNTVAKTMTIRTSEALYTVDGERITSDAPFIEVGLGLRLRLAVSPTSALRPGLRRAADAVGAVKP